MNTRSREVHWTRWGVGFVAIVVLAASGADARQATPKRQRYVRIDGQRVAAGVAEDFIRMRAAFREEFGLDLRVTSGIRTRAEQEAIFRARYVPLSQVGGRQVYDQRTWNGVRYARVSKAGTVAVPGTSLHEESGPRGARALDLRDSGRDAGVTVAGTARANWLKANATRFHFKPAGYSFGEPWHYESTRANPFVASPKPASETALKPTQRRARAVVNRRAEATSQSKAVGEPLQEGEVGDFVGWKHGERVQDNDVWFKDTRGAWFWSGGFEDGARTAGLKDLNR